MKMLNRAGVALLSAALWAMPLSPLLSAPVRNTAPAALPDPADAYVPTTSVGFGKVGETFVPVSTDDPLPVTTQAPAQSAVTGSVSAATITNSSASILSAASRRLLAIKNESATASIACAFGATAALNTAGSFTIPPLNLLIWRSYPVPADAANCISSVASSPATVEVN
jgi:hypothetical protein